MRAGRRLALVTLAVLTVLLSSLVGCSTGPAPEELKAQKAQEDWALLESAKADLSQKRGELAALTARIAEAVDEAAEDSADETAEPAETAESLQARADELEQSIATQAEELTTLLIDFINEQGMEVGVPPTEIQLAAIRMKSDEEIVIAREYIEKAGDYSRAIDIYQTALGFDPDNEKLKAALADAEVNRFMSQERFAQVKKKMSQAEVRSLLGQVRRQLIREYEDDNAVAWFYGKEDTGAAGVFFRESRVGRDDWTVYHTDFNAIKPRQDTQ